MRGVKWLVRHKMAMLTWDLHKGASNSSRKYARAGLRRAQSKLFSMTSIRTQGADVTGIATALNERGIPTASG
jgi:hypothetical protein